MNNFFINFFLGLFCTLFLLVVSVILTLGIKSLNLFYLDLAKKSAKSTPAKKPSLQKKTKPKKPPSTVVRSIEIDPEQIDKIYVKKIV